MAQDATYQTKVYHERGGERYVAASGGTLAVESGGSAAIYSGANYTIESGATLDLAGTETDATNIRRILLSEWGAQQTVIIGDNSIDISASNVPKNCRIFTIVASDAATQPSIWMTSCSAGRELYLRLVGDLTGTFTNADTALTVLRSGCIILNSLGAALPSFLMYASAASDCGIFFKAVADNVWAIIAEVGTNMDES